MKAPEEGDPVSENLAEKIYVACISAFKIDKITSEHKVPQNCDKACSPPVNHEIWRVLDSRAQTQDKTIQGTQHLVATGMTPIIKLAEVIKPQIRNSPQAKTLLSDALTLLGQVHFNLPIMRRYYIGPNLRRKYHSLYNISTKITDKLFGDDISKESKVVSLKMVSARTTSMAIEGHTEAVSHSIQDFLDEAMLVVMAMGFSSLVMV